MKTSKSLIFFILWAFARCTPEPPAAPPPLTSTAAKAPTTCDLPTEPVLAEARPPKDKSLEFQIWAAGKLVYRFGRDCIIGYKFLKKREHAYHVQLRTSCLPDSVIQLVYPVELRCYLEGEIWYQAAFYTRPTSDMRPYEIAAMWTNREGLGCLSVEPKQYWLPSGMSETWRFSDANRSFIVFCRPIPTAAELKPEWMPRFLPLYMPYSCLFPPWELPTVYAYRYLEHPRYRRVLSRKK